MKNDISILDYMFRYLEKYTGKYRVLPYYDLDTKDFPRDENGDIDNSFDDLYIPCKKGIITHTYKDFDKLAFCMYDKRKAFVKGIYNEIKNKYKKIDIDLEISGSDGFIYFNAKDINKIATIVKPKTSGAKIKWDSNKNLPKIDYKIPSSDIKLLNNELKNLSKIDKMHFMKKCNSEFLSKISTNKFDAKSEFKNSRLQVKEYIHSINMWDKYIKFIKKELKKRSS